MAPNAKEMPCDIGLPVLPEEVQISPQDYQQHVLDAAVPHILLDVRNPHHFSICSLPHADNLPLADLVRDPQKLADLVQQKVSTLMAVHPDAPPPNIYCLCRRGNASTRATSFLLRLLGKFRSPEEAMEQGGEVPLVDPILSTLQVFNIAGGLQQYASTVNPRFPLY